MKSSRHIGRRPRIGINLLRQMPGDVTGTSRYTDSLLDALIRRKDLDLIVFCPTGRVEIGPTSPILKVVPTPKIKNAFLRTAYEQSLFPLLAASFRLDALFSPNYVSPLWGPFKRVMTIHDMYAWQIPWSVRLGTRLHRRLLVPPSAFRCHAIVAVSENTAHDIRTAFPWATSKIHVIHEACTFDVECTVSKPLDLSPPQRQPYVLMVANVEPNKDIETVAAAARQLQDSNLNCPIYVIGADPQSLMAQAIERYGAAGALVPVGRVDDQTLHAYFRYALCTIHPSAYEGFGLPVLEAQALGSPVICTRRGALPEVAGSAALYFDYGNPKQLAEAIRYLLNNPAQCEALATRGIKNVKRFSWDRAAAETVALLQNVLNA